MEEKDLTYLALSFPLLYISLFSSVVSPKDSLGEVLLSELLHVNPICGFQNTVDGMTVLLMWKPAEIKQALCGK